MSEKSLVRKLWITAEGQEAIATGKNMYTWHYIVREQDEEPYKEDEICVAEFSITLPPVAKLIPVVMEHLRVKEAEIQAEAYKDVMKIKERREKLLAITNEPTQA